MASEMTDIVWFLLSRDFNIGVVVGILLSVAVCWHHDRQKERRNAERTRPSGRSPWRDRLRGNAE